MIDNDTLRKLRQLDLFYILPQIDPSGWNKISSAQLKGVLHDSCIITLGKGWSWFSCNKFSRNPITFLMDYYNLAFKDAVQHLVNNSTPQLEATNNSNKAEVNRSNSLPQPSDGNWDKLYQYLCKKRCISQQTIDSLIKSGILYQSSYTSQYARYDNLCFINPENKHYEVVGLNKHFKGISDGVNYWVYNPGSGKAYVCESAIDAISLFELIKDENFSYISLGGCISRKKVLRKIIADYHEVILAIDNDDAGNELAAYYSALQRIIPNEKDWNEDLIQKIKSLKLK